MGHHQARPVHCEKISYSFMAPAGKPAAMPKKHSPEDFSAALFRVMQAINHREQRGRMAGKRKRAMSGKRDIGGRIKKLEEELGISLRGFKVSAADGQAGKIEQVLYWSDNRVPDYIVVSNRRWLLARKSVLPVEAIDRIDVKARRLKIGLSRQEIREAPEYLPL